MFERPRVTTLGDVLTKLDEAGHVSPDNEEAIATRLSHHVGGGLGHASVRVLAGIGAWIAALSFLGFVELTQLLSGSSERVVFGVILIGGAALLQRRDAGAFLAQLGVALGLAGKMTVAVGVGIMAESFGTAVVVSLVLWLATYPFLTRPGDRFVTTVGTLGVTLSWLIIERHPSWVAPLTLGALLVATVLFSRRRLPSALRPMAYGLVMAAPVLLTMELAPSAVLPELLTGPESAAHWVFKLAFVTALVYLFAWASDFQMKLFESPLIVAVGGTIVLGLVTTPGLLAAFALLLLGFGRAERPLLWMGFLFLVVFVGTFYYNLQMTLLLKSMTLMLSGAALLVARVGLRYLRLETEVTT